MYRFAWVVVCLVWIDSCLFGLGLNLVNAGACCGWLNAVYCYCGFGAFILLCSVFGFLDLAF